MEERNEDGQRKCEKRRDKKRKHASDTQPRMSSVNND